MSNISQQAILKSLITIASALVCALLLFTRIPGMEIFGIGPNWLLIWVVAWSSQSSTIEALVAGLVLGLIQDGITAPYPTHVIPLVFAGFVIVFLQKQRFIQEDFIFIALVTFILAIIAETFMAIQLGLIGNQTFGEIWVYHKQVALGSAVISSLWAPVIYFPLSQLWKL
ncbi:MAG: rod shape-determining protein MreD [Okeania sp. SIO2C2]|uniref:rod shape-determining protein MreD n=1 Tax=Okeania sp. SIO2C2 TaxID=2607787 RepID=UPI0013B99F6E|nr:rod shape-determining protein MreD [Okeania sp. SIO2C2]NEP87470.1 rod shape-determining protein MreD [Okeania sp. SIO2C2]